MKRQRIMRASQIGRFALFLAEHPGFWPELVGEDALVCGFHVGGCFLTIDEMEKLVAAQPVLEAHSVASEASYRPQ
jgi:hypothetical protein